MSEVSVVKSRASVMLYNNEKKVWEPAEGIRGMSYVQVYHHEGNNTYRIVGRCMTDHNVVVINCSIIRNMKYNAATPTFHQWRDQRQVYGLNFHSKDDAEQFKGAIDGALEDLNSVSQRTSHTQQYVAQTPKSWQNRYASQNSESHSAGDETSSRSHTETTVNQDYRRPSQEPISNEKPKTVSSSVTITPAVPVPPAPPSVPQPPAAPTPPAPPTTPAVPAAPPAPPSGGVGVPAPPPPPPPPSAGGGGNGGGGGSLAAQIAAAKLKKAESKPEPKPSGGSSGPFGGDMMAEMQRKLAARKAKEGGNEDAAPRNQVDMRTDRLPAVNKTPAPKTNHVPPSPLINSSSSKSMSRIERSSSSEPLSSNQLQELKMEILAEFRKELEAAKADIIQAMRQELSRAR